MASAPKSNSISEESGPSQGGRGKGRAKTSSAEDRRNPFSGPPLIFKMNSSLMGFIIGKGGWRIKAIEDVTNTKILIKKGASELTVKIFGQKQCRLKAKAAIQDVGQTCECQQTPTTTGPRARLLVFYSAMSRVSGVQVKSSLDWVRYCGRGVGPPYQAVLWAYSRLFA